MLPHPGGGGETYVDLLAEMPGYRFERVYLGPSPSPSPRLASGIARAARAARGHDIVHVHGEAAAGLCLPVLATRPSVVTLHGLHLVRRLRGLARRAAVVNLHAILRAADQTICVSESEHDELFRAVGPDSARRGVVIRNGVRVPVPADTTARAEVREEVGLSESEPVAIWVGSLDERKDPLNAIRAAASTGIALLVVGDGPLRARVEREASAATRVLGHRHDVPRLLAAADIFVMTSRREAPALSLLEAMAHGLPPVVIELPENLEAIGDTGISVRAEPRSLAAALRRLADKPDERAMLGPRAAERIARLFNAEDMIRRTRAVYDRVLARQG